MACGCNKKSAISMSSQLPPGCDSILKIDTDALETETMITITFCSGAVQQFNIPHGTNGIDGSSGGNGSDGTNGDSVENVEVTQEGSTVNLTFTIGGVEQTISFELPAATNSAYIVEHKSQSNSQYLPEGGADFTQINLTEPSTSEIEIIKGTIPGSTIVNAGDTLHWDAVFMVNSSNVKTVFNVFKSLFVCIGNNNTISDDAVVNLMSNPGMSIPNDAHAQVNIELSKTNSTRDELYIKGTYTIYDNPGNVTIEQSDSITELDSPLSLRGSYGFYKLVPFTSTVENFIQLRGLSDLAGESDITATLDPIYMTLTKIPKL